MNYILGVNRGKHSYWYIVISCCSRFLEAYYDCNEISNCSVEKYLRHIFEKIVNRFFSLGTKLVTKFQYVPQFATLLLSSSALGTSSKGQSTLSTSALGTPNKGQDTLSSRALFARDINTNAESSVQSCSNIQSTFTMGLFLAITACFGLPRNLQHRDIFCKRSVRVSAYLCQRLYIQHILLGLHTSPAIIASTTPSSATRRTDSLIAPG